MKLVTIRTQDGLHVGAVTEQGVVDLTAGAGLRPEAVYQHTPAELTAMAQQVGGAVPENQVALGPCVPNPGKVICVGLNYRRHAAESGMDVPTTPLLFSKFANALAGPDDEVAIPADTAQMDYEAEMTIVIGRRASNVREDEALDYVFGYCNANDLSARDLQFRTAQWLLGKTVDGFCPIGPYLVTADEVADPDALGIRLWVNGEQRQDSHTSDLIFSCRQLISYISRYMTLEPGDMILTGTPEGVAFGYPPEVRESKWLKAGDTVTVEIDGLGRLTNRMTDRGY